MSSPAAVVPPGVRSLFEYSVTETEPDHAASPHRGLPSSTLTLVFATDAPLLCSATAQDWAERRGTTHDVCLGSFHLEPVYLQRPRHQEGVQVAVHPLAARRLLGLPASALTELSPPTPTAAASAVSAMSAGPGRDQKWWARGSCWSGPPVGCRSPTWHRRSR